MSTRFTVLLPVYNGSAFIERAIISVLNQNYDNFELIIINDGSIDDTYKICEKYVKSNECIRCYEKDNGGISSARNFALKKALESKINTKIIWLDSDDELSPSLLKKLNNLFLEYPNCDLIFYDYDLIYDNNVTYNDYLNARFHNYGLQTGVDLLSQLLIGDINNYLWSFAADINLYSNIDFPLKKKYEDVGTVYKILRNIECGYVSDIKGYKYHVDNQMSLTKNFSVNDAYDLFYLIKNMDVFKEENLKKLCYIFQAIYLVNITINLASNKDEKSKKLIEEVEAYFSSLKCFLHFREYKYSRYSWKILAMKLKLLRPIYKIKGVLS